MKIRATAYGDLLCKPPCRAPANGYLLRDWLHPVHSGQVPLELLQISGVVLPVVHGRVDLAGSLPQQHLWFFSMVPSLRL
jgi:hypothetical protein